MGKKEGDPMQMAYSKGRGVVATNLISFNFVDVLMRQTGEPVYQYFGDLVKAFNSANRSTMLKYINRITGAGELCYSRFVNRTYTYEGEIRGQDQNRGCDPGAPISVFGFKLFVCSDLALTAL